MSDNELIEYIRSSKEEREIVIRSLYSNPSLRAGLQKVLSLSQDSMEFQDIFNLTLVQFMKTVIRNKDFNISSNLHSYLFVIARNIAAAKHKKNRIETVGLERVETQVDTDEKSIDLQIVDNENKQILKGIIEKMGRNCYEILWNWASGFSMKEIASILGYNSDEVVRRKKYVCLKRLSSFLDDNPNIKTHFNGFHER